MFGRPLMVGDAHVPAKGELAGEAAADAEDEDDDEDEAVVPLDAVTLDGAVGTSKFVLLWKPQAVSRTEPRSVAISVICFIGRPLQSCMRAHNFGRRKGLAAGEASA